MEHSRLLKHILPAYIDKTKMAEAEPVKIKFEYQNPNNVEAEVPGAQKLREADNNENGEMKHDVTVSKTELHSEVKKDNDVNNGEDKEDDKKMRTKIPMSRFRQTAERVKAKRRGSKDKKPEPESHIPIRRSSFPKQTVKKAPTKPTRKSIQVTSIEIPKPTVQEDEFDKLYEEVVHGTPTPIDINVSLLNPKVEDPDKLESKFEEIIHDYDEKKAQPIDVEKRKKSKIPFFKRKSQQEIEVRNSSGNMIAARDKLRMSHHSARSDDLKNVKVEKTFSVVTDDMRMTQHSAKAKSDDSNAMKTEETFQLVTDNVKMSPHSGRSDNTKDVKIEEAFSVVTSGNQKAETVEIVNNVTALYEKVNSTNVKLEETSHTEIKDETSLNNNGEEKSREVFSTTIVREIKTTDSKKGLMMEENICRDYIKVGIPVFESYVYESTEEGKTESSVEVTVEPSYTPNNDCESVKFDTSYEVIEINNKPLLSEVIGDKEQSAVEIVDISETTFETYSVTPGKEQEIEDTTVVLNDKDDSFTDTEKLRFQDDIIISKKDTLEPVNAHKIAFGNDIPKKKSVLSKIAMFERHEVVPVIKSKIPKKNTPPLTITPNSKLPKHAHIHTPLIVDEVFKPFPTKIEQINENNVENENDKDIHDVRAEMVLIKSLETVEYGVEDKAEIESNTLFIEQSLVTEEVLKPMLMKYEAINKEQTTKTGNEKIFKDKSKDTLVEVPKFIPVREVRKRYESLNDNDALVNNKDIEDLPEAKMVLIESPESAQFGVENKLQIESNTMLIEQSLIVEEVLKPEIRKYERKLEDKPKQNVNERVFNQKSKDVPVVVPTFIPVREFLKRYESLNGNDAHVNNKTEDLSKTKMIESPETIQYGTENKVQIEHSLVAEEVLKPVSKKYPPKSKDESKFDKEIIFKEKSTDIPVPKFIPVKEVLKKYECLNGNVHVHNKIIEDLPKTRPISEIIKTLKPESEPRSLDIMFAHQVTPVSDILKDLKPEAQNEKTEIVYAKDTYNDVNIPRVDSTEEHQRFDKTKHGFKSFRSRGYDYATLDNRDDNFKTLQFIQDYNKAKNEDLKRAKSTAELDLGDVVKGKVSRLIVRINSVEKIDSKEVPIKEKPMRRSVSEKIALFERKSTPTKAVSAPIKQSFTGVVHKQEELTAEIQAKISELSTARLKYGKMATMPRVQLANGVSMPVLAVGTALLDPRLAYHIVTAAIDLGYRAIDTAFIYGNERLVGEAINDKIKDGTVTREELFITSKLWSTFHRTDLVVGACEGSLRAMGLEYFDLYLIHNPMSLKEGGSPMPKIATVLQYSQSDYLDAWFGMETLGSRARAVGVSNFNSDQIKRVLDRARVKPVVNQVECHPYLSQQKLGDYCNERNISLNCFGVLGSKGTPAEMKSGQAACIDDPLLQVMASGLGVSPAQLLIRYQLECGHTVVVKSSSAAHLWDNLQALTFNLTLAQIDALHALNRNKRNFTFKGMGDTHKNYPFKTLF